MFYLEQSGDSFFLGYVEENNPVAMLLGGTTTKGVTSKQEVRCETQQEAWEALCTQVALRTRNGFVTKPYPGYDRFLPPDNPFTGVYPDVHKGVRVRFTAVLDEQFKAGLDRLRDVHAVLGKEYPKVKVSVTEYGFEYSSPTHKVTLRKLSSAEWETYGTRAKEVFTDRGFVDTENLLPSGDGVWWIPTRQELLDVYLRAFLGEVSASGGRFTSDGGEEWSFNPKKPFEIASVSNMQWYRSGPSIISSLSAAKLLGGPKLSVPVVNSANTFALFL